MEDLQPFFESRDTRLQRLPEDVRARLTMAAEAARRAGDTEFEDKQFTSLWLSQRTGIPRQQVIDNFQGIASRFFGEGVTPGGAYDAIAAQYKPSDGQGGAADGQAEEAPLNAKEDAEWAPVTGFAKPGATALMDNIGQAARSMVSGFEGSAQKSPAGLYSQLAAGLGFEVKAVGDDEAFAQASSRAKSLDPALSMADNPFEVPMPNLFGMTGMSPERMELLFGANKEPERQAQVDDAREQMAIAAARVNMENTEALKQWRESTRGQLSTEYRRLADFWYTLSNAAPERWSVTPEWQNSTMGQFMQSAGSVPATAAMAALGIGGWVAMESSFFADVEQERMTKEGAAYDPVKALPANLLSAAPQMVMEKMFGVERLLNKVLGEIPKQGGKVLFGDYAKQVIKQGLAAGVEEGITEPAQGFWNDYVASLTYDEKRETLTGDAAKRRLIESISGFALGALFGGGVATVDAIDQARAEAPAELLTTRTGDTMGPADFKVLGEVKTEAEIAATAPDEETGKLLLAATKGDKQAQTEYNKRVLEAKFVKTEDVEVGGMALGLVENVPVIRMADSAVIPLDMTQEEDRNFIGNFKREVARQQALNETADFLRKGLEEGRTLEVTEEARTFQNFIDEAKIEVKDAVERIGIAQDVNAVQVPNGTNPEDIKVLGSNASEYSQGVYRDVSTVYGGGNALTAIEEVSEGYVKKRLAVGDLNEAELTAWRESYEKDTGTKTTTTGTISNIEWFSKRAVDYAVLNRKVEGMPKSWGAFLRTLGEHLKTVFRLSQRLAKLKRDGKLGANFEDHLKGALGIVSAVEVMDSIDRRNKAMDTEADSPLPPVSDIDPDVMTFATQQEDFPRIAPVEGEGFVVTSPTSEEIGSAPSVEDAITKATKWYDAQYRGEEMEAVRKLTENDTGKATLLSDLVRLGGLTALGNEPTFKGELRAIGANLPVHLRMKLFRKSAKKLDAVREKLNENGYNYETIADMLDDIEQATRKLAAQNARGYKVSFSLIAGKLDRKQVDMFAGGQTGGDTLFSLQGEEAKDFTGIVDKQAADREANAKQEAAQSEITFAVTGLPQNQLQALQAQAQRIRSKKLNATGELIARIRAGQSVPARVRAVRQSTQASLLAKLLVPISTRLKAIAPELAVRLRRFEFDSGQQLSRDYERTLPFAQAVEKMKDRDAAILDLALKNGDVDSRDAILRFYGAQTAFNDVLAVIAEVKARAIAAGYEVGTVADYFPRKVADLDGLFVHYYGKPQAGAIEKALTEAADKALKQGRVLTHEERMEITNTALRGYAKKDSKPGNVKARTTEVVSADANKFYTDSVTALGYYLESMNAAIEKRRFFGKYSVPVAAVPGANTSRLNLEASIGGLVEGMIAAGELDRKQQAEITSILEGRFNQQAGSEFVKNFKALAYMTTMGHLTSGLTQIQDVAFSLYENGVYDTIIAGSQAIVRKSKVSRKDLGLNSPAEEFRDVGKMHKAVNRVFKLTGIHYLDLVGKETLVNAKLRKMQREANGNGLGKRSQSIISTIYGPKGAQVVADIAAGNFTDDVKFAAYHVLADYQPLSLAEYPEYYLRHPNGRVFYMLKTFTLKQVDAFRRESFTMMVRGNAKQKVEGFRNLIHMAGLLFMVGMPVDWLKDWIMNRDPQLSDLAVDNLFKLTGINRWNLWQFRENPDPVRAALMLAAPPAPFLTYPLLDVKTSAEEIAKGDEVKPSEFESWRMLPFIGSPIYWYLGGGPEKVEKRRRKREKAESNESRIKR